MSFYKSPEGIQSDPCASYWLKAAVRSACDRDPVDALADAEALVAVLRARWQSITAEHAPPRRTVAGLAGWRSVEA